MSLINQVLRELDARGAAGRTGRHNPWSPDAARAEEAHFHPYPAGWANPGTQPVGRVRARRPGRPGGGGRAWQQGLVAGLAGVLLAMVIATPWAPQLASVPEPSAAPGGIALAGLAAPAAALSAAAPMGFPSAVRTLATAASPSSASPPAAQARAKPVPAEPAAALPALAALAVEQVPPPSAGVARKAAPALAATAAGATAASAAAAAPVTPSALATATALPPGEGGTVEKKLSPLTVAQRAQASYAQAVESVQTGRPVQALGQAMEALRLQPGHQAARHLAAILLHETARTGQAVDLLREGLALDPRADALSLLMARLQAHQGLQAEAVATLDRHQLHTLEAEGLRAGLWSQLHQYKQAIQAYQATLEKQPGQVTWWLGLAVALEGDGQTALARQTFARVQAMGVADPELGAYVAQRLKALE